MNTALLSRIGHKDVISLIVPRFKRRSDGRRMVGSGGKGSPFGQSH
jgi:hypothetical protein